MTTDQDLQKLIEDITRAVIDMLEPTGLPASFSIAILNEDTQNVINGTVLSPDGLDHFAILRQSILNSFDNAECAPDEGIPFKPGGNRAKYN